MSVPTAPLALRVYRSLAGYWALGDYGAFCRFDAENDYAVAKYCTALESRLELALAAFTDGAWIDSSATPDEFVQWLASVRGVDPRGADLATLRQWIPDGGPTRQRGGDEAMRLRVEQVLTGTKTIRFSPRTDPAFPGVDSPWNTLIRVRSDEAPTPSSSIGSNIVTNVFAVDLTGWDLDGGWFVNAPTSANRVADSGAANGYTIEVAATGGGANEGVWWPLTLTIGEKYIVRVLTKTMSGVDEPQVGCGPRGVGGILAMSGMTAVVVGQVGDFDLRQLTFTASQTDYDLVIREASSGGVTFRAATPVVAVWSPEVAIVAAARDRAAPVWQRVHCQVLDGDAIDELTGPISGLTGNIEDL